MFSLTAGDIEGTYFSGFKLSGCVGEGRCVGGWTGAGRTALHFSVW